MIALAGATLCLLWVLGWLWLSSLAADPLEPWTPALGAREEYLEGKISTFEFLERVDPILVPVRDLSPTGEKAPGGVWGDVWVDRCSAGHRFDGRWDSPLTRKLHCGCPEPRTLLEPDMLLAFLHA